MRITNGMMSSTFLADLQKNLTQVYEKQMQQSSGKRVQKLSDDPVGIIQGLNARTQLSRIEQFQRDLTTAKQWLEQSETYMSEISKTVQSVLELATQAASDSMVPEDRKTASGPAARAMLNHLVDTLNSTIGDEFAYGGFNTKDNKPIAKATAADITATGGVSPSGATYAEGDWLYNGEPLSSFDAAKVDANAAANDLQFQVGYNTNMSVSKTAPQLIVYDRGTPPKNLIDKLEDLCDKLETGTCTGADVNAFIGDFQQAQAQIDATVSEMGGRSNRCDMLENRYSKDDLMYSTVKSTLEDVDIAEAIMEFSMAQAVYTASLQVGSKVIQPTLLDYLR